MSSWFQYESKARWKAPIKKRRGGGIWGKNRKGQCRMNLKGMKFTWAAWFWPAIEDLSLGKRWPRVWIWTKTPMDCRERE
jgi:hypothetical protein